MHGHDRAIRLVRAAILCGLLAAAARGGGAPGEDGLEENLRRTRAFACRVPQPRAVEPERLLTERRTDERAMPPTTVLHRCEDAGCCGPGLVCAADRVREVTVWFRLTSYVNGTCRLLDVPAFNHTHCACQLPDETRK